MDSAAPSENVVVRDVGPRDGIQSLGVPVSTVHKAEIIRSLIAAGVRRIEVGSFVSPKAVPQMADTQGVLDLIGRPAGVGLETLVLNGRGVDRALEAGSSQLVTVVAASDTFSHRNAGMSRSEALDVAARALEVARRSGIGCVVDVATSFGCAYEGRVPAETVVETVRALVDAGYDEVTLADTIGAAVPTEVTGLVEAVRDAVGHDVVVGLHFHNTRGLGLVNVMAGLAAGVRLFDASVGGIGGCPFSPGATGNVSTEDLVHLLDAIGYRSGIDLGRLLDAAHLTEDLLGFPLPGQLLRAGPRFARQAA